MTLNNSTMETTQATFASGYKEYVLTQGSAPASVYQFCKTLGLEEGAYYEAYNSFAALEAEIWLGYHTTTLDRLQAEESYLGYTVREKWLAYYFTLLEELKADRSFVVWCLTHRPHTMPGNQPCLAQFKTQFQVYAQERVTEGTDTGEIATRPFITGQYSKAAWLQCLFILDFWLKDQSRNFELTDAAVEKTINLGMDIAATNALDSAFDFAKFVWQNRG